MEATQHIVELNPSAVELVDRTMIDLARDIPIFASTVDRFVQGEPQALLLVEFSGEEQATQLRSLSQLVELVESLGSENSVVEATDNEFQQAIWEVGKSGLIIMMSMKGDGKPVSFTEDCAVELKELADYTRRVNVIYQNHGPIGSSYAHESVCCLHVRSILNMTDASHCPKQRG